MSLTTALFTGLSGLNVNQAALDTIGNNIANVNTNAYKSTRTLFQSQFSDGTQFGTPPSATFGGTNPSQQGLGVTVGSIQRNFEPGNIKPTGYNTDLAIQGEGMFVVEGAERYYTRNGSFQLNAAKYLVTQEGHYLMGYGVDGNFNVLEGQLERLRVPTGTMITAAATSEVVLEGQLSKGELATAGTILQSQTFTNGGGGPVTAATALTSLEDGGLPAFVAGQELVFTGQRGGLIQGQTRLEVTGATTVQELMDFMVGSFGINTADPLQPSAGASIVADGAGFRIAINGNPGQDNALSIGAGGLQLASGGAPLTFSQSQAAVGTSVHTSITAYDSLGQPVPLNLTFVYESSDNTGTTWRFYANSSGDTDASSVVGMGTVSFDTTGRFRSATDTDILIDRDQTGAITPLTISLNLSSAQGNYSQADANQSAPLAAVLQNGSSSGTLTDFSVGADGRVIGSFSNGITRTLGQVAVASFSNYPGLIDAGASLYKAGPNSGEPVVAPPLTNGSGRIVGSALETSNVDISEEFINMIIASTGFSASSRVITTGNQLMTELLGLVR